jgi:Fe-S-cluster-containing hydrogenase component 2
VDPSECYGCGLCASVCPYDAIVLSEAREPAHIPHAQSDAPGFVIPRQSGP